VTEGEAQQFLVAMQNRLASDPRAAFGLSAMSNERDVRTAFLTLTKQYHPIKFARQSATIQRLANEVFLSLREAHDVLAHKPKIGSTPAFGTQRPANLQNLVAGKLTKPATNPTPVVKAGNEPTAIPKPAAMLPAIASTAKAPAVRFSTATPAAVDEAQTFAAGKELLRQRKWNDAQAAFETLAAQQPQQTAYRAMLALASGRIAQEQGNIELARTQFQSAIDLEHNFAAAAAALEELPVKATDAKSLWSKLRGK
jgi:tetratricopeptide (TPR) repeat protein